MAFSPHVDMPKNNKKAKQCVVDCANSEATGDFDDMLEEIRAADLTILAAATITSPSCSSAYSSSSISTSNFLKGNSSTNHITAANASSDTAVAVGNAGKRFAVPENRVNENLILRLASEATSCSSSAWRSGVCE
jgi:hypothetical protein